MHYVESHGITDLDVNEQRKRPQAQSPRISVDDARKRFYLSNEVSGPIGVAPEFALLQLEPTGGDSDVVPT
jgi:hypothetical protein